jgi:hypothetical protein
MQFEGNDPPAITPFGARARRARLKTVRVDLAAAATEAVT